MRWRVRRSNARRLMLAGLGGLFLALLAYQWWGQHGYRALQASRQEQRDWEARNEALRRRNAGLEKSILDLRTRPEPIEKRAREDLHWTRPGERVIRSPQKP